MVVYFLNDLVILKESAEIFISTDGFSVVQI